MSAFGTFLDRQRQQARRWFKVFLVLLVALLGCNAVILPMHPHFGYDAFPGFWAAFGLGVGLVMIFVMKRIVQPLIVRKEDYYGDL